MEDTAEDGFHTLFRPQMNLRYTAKQPIVILCVAYRTIKSATINIKINSEQKKKSRNDRENVWNYR